MTPTQELACRPQCRSCGERYILRSLTAGSEFAQACGVWYDHPLAGTCGQRTSSVLYRPSEELQAEWERQAKALARQAVSGS